jgi:hypothetical protein
MRLFLYIRGDLADEFLVDILGEKSGSQDTVVKEELNYEVGVRERG